MDAVSASITTADPAPPALAAAPAPLDPAAPPPPPGRPAGSERLTAFVRDYCRLLPATEHMEPHQALTTLADFLVRDFPAAVRHALDAGLGEPEIVTALTPLRAVVSQSDLVRRAQEQPRGLPGDFEMIEYILARKVTGRPGTFGRLFDEYLQHSVVAQQHHNKIAHQAGLIEAALTEGRAAVGGFSRGPARRILLIACGGAADLRRVDPGLPAPGDRFVLNDMDPDALAHAMATLPAPTAAHVTTVQGNALRKAAELASEGPYDLVLAGGLFDYLEERPARALVRSVMERLCRPGGTFYFSNIATGNPFAVAMKYGASWPLIEREEADVEAVVRDAAGHLVADLDIRRDTTGLTLLTRIRRTPEPTRGAGAGAGTRSVPGPAPVPRPAEPE